MHKLIIHKLGPIEECELQCSQFMTFTGFQASGKSTIAKAIYYFRTIKEDILDLIRRQAFHLSPIDGLINEGSDITYGAALEQELKEYLIEKFFMTFGPSCRTSAQMQIEYHYTNSCFIIISLEKNVINHTSNELNISFSKDLIKFLQKINNSFPVTPIGIDEELQSLKTELNCIFDDPYSVVYIPAGRSILTLLSEQLSYIYITMDDFQKRSLDLCTKDYLERILRIKSEFSEGLSGLALYYRRKSSLPSAILNQALNLIQQVLRGTYRYKNGEEQILLDDGNFVKINFSSSGQQESVWILNLLFYYLLQQKQILFIIEEPESHLFPASQKYITELITLVNNCNHSILLTTHSPYVLGALNNLLYAHTLPQHCIQNACKIIPKSLWLDDNYFDAWFVKNGVIENCIDPEIHMIQNERIDDISKVINNDFDRLLELQNTVEEGV